MAIISVVFTCPLIVIILNIDELETVTNIEQDNPNEVNLDDGILEEDSFFVIDREGDDPDKPIEIVEAQKSKKLEGNSKKGIVDSKPKRKSKRYWQSEMDSLENPSTLNPKKKRRTFEEPFETDFTPNDHQVRVSKNAKIQISEFYPKLVKIFYHF